MNRLRQDIAHGLRRLGRAPGFATIAIATLALGIGANTAIFSVVSAVLLRPLPYGDPEHLVMLWAKLDRGATMWVSAPEVEQYSGESSTFASVAAYTSSAGNLTSGQEPERIVVGVVTPNIFETLRVAPLAGRAFTAADDAARIGDQIVLGYGLWQRRFGGSREIIGRRVLLDGTARIVIGVMPEGFKLPLDFRNDRPSELWEALDVRAPEWMSWGNHSFTSFARLQGRVTPALATATLRKLEDRWVQEGVGGGWTRGAAIVHRAAVPMKDLVLGDLRYALWVLLGAVGAILLIACANVANLLLARSDDRRREIAVRTAIGASRARILQQMLTESMLLSFIGGVAGLGLAFAALRVLHAIRPPGIPRIDETGLDVGVLAFTAILAIATGVLFGVAPALALSRPDVSAALNEGGRTGTIGRRSQRFRDSLAITQMALSVVLLIAALLLVRSFIALRHIDPGFDPRNAVTLRISLPEQTYASGADAFRMIRTLRQRFSELPGVRAVGAARLLPLTGTIGDWSITLEGRVKRPGENPAGDWQIVTPGYFEAMGVRLVQGRFFAETDDERAPIVAVINETMAARYWPNEVALGKRFHIGDSTQPWITVVGIVGEVRHNALTGKARAEMYVPHTQWEAAGAVTPRGMTFVIRTRGDPLTVLPSVRQAVRSLDPALPLSAARTLQQVVNDALSQARFTTLLLGLFAAVAMTLAAIGIFGVISLLVTRRRHELGIRLALGARPTSILRMVVARGLTLASTGVAAGLIAALLTTRLIASLLYDVTPLDPLTFVVVPAVLALVALLACFVPAVRAAALDPIIALRQE